MRQINSIIRSGWGEEALVLKNRPEAVIYKYNTLALEAAKSLFNQPLEIATSLPISRRDGIDDAEEVLRGIAVAQHDWNESHPNTQFVIAIADDGYQDSKDEISSAKRAAEEILGYQKILGVIGHFTSAATQATAKDYNDKDVVLVSPTSTAVRCEQEVDIEEDSCLSIGSNSNVFRTAINDRLASHRLVDYISGNRPNVSKVAVLYESDDPYSRSFKEMFMDGAEELSTGPRKLEVINTRGVEEYSDCNFSDYNPKNPKLSRQQVKGCFDTYAKGADTLLLVPSIKDDQWVEEVLMVNYEEGYDFNLLGSDSMYQESFINQKGVEREEAAGLLIPVTWHRSSKTCISSSTSLECNKNEFQNWEGINWRTATGYDAAQALFSAIDIANKRCTWGRYVGSRADCIKRQLVDTLENIELEEGTSGDPIKFTDGDRDAKGVVVEAVGGFFETVSQ